jgi:hypothetical protein
MVTVVFEKVSAPRVRFQCLLRGSSSGWMRAVTNHRHHRHRALQDPSDGVWSRNGPLVRVCRRRHRSRYRRKGCAPELCRRHREKHRRY